MVIKPFGYYIKEGLARRSIHDPIIAKELLRKGEVRLLRISKIPPTAEESSIIFEDVYEALRESAQSLMELEGFKPYSHEALIAYLDDKKLFPPGDINTLNNYRILRNNSVYKAETISLEKCKESICFATMLIPCIKEKLSQLLSTNRKV